MAAAPVGPYHPDVADRPVPTGRLGSPPPHRVYELCERVGDPLLLFTALLTIPL